ncbi:FAM57A [Branchiostoma lanceolatum]|uniref:FAM57A protein n=1 Tax=Branchiostoma lanceolatum TaxID=7740 RepID=A0A8K0EXX3_BRALA|nr:FAM57A [Branchiostoma lanceolatum]
MVDNTQDKMGYDSLYMLTLAGSFVFHLVISEWLSYPLLRKLSPVFVTLPANKQVVLRNRFYTPIFVHAACIFVGHTAVDCVLMAMYAPLRDWRMALHHVVSMWAFCNSIVVPAGLYFASTWYLAELSTPFVNMRLILHTLGHRRSLLYKVNGVVMLVVFFLCRILTIPIWFGVIPHMKTGELYKIGSGPLINIFVLNPIMFVLNIFWFIKIFSAVLVAELVWVNPRPEPASSFCWGDRCRSSKNHRADIFLLLRGAVQKLIGVHFTDVKT